MFATNCVFDEAALPSYECGSFDRYTFDLTLSLFAGHLKNEVAGSACVLLSDSHDIGLSTGQTAAAGDVIEELPDVSFANNSTFIESRVYWIGPTWPRALAQRVGLGVSTLFATRSQNARIQNSSTLL